MASYLIIYGTGEGQTAKVATHIETTLEVMEHDVTVTDIEDLDDTVDVAVYDAVLVGSSIHAGKHHTKVLDFLRQHVDDLESLSSGFFQVSLSSAGDDEAKATAAGYVESLIESTGWQPDRIGQFGGALRYSEYGFLKRSMMRRLVGRAMGTTDTSRDYEFTDWDEVTAFTEDFVTIVEASQA